MLKYLIVLVGLLTANLYLLAQQDTTNNYINRFVTIPAIHLHLVPDSAIFSNATIQKNRPFVIMFFTPDCDHCQQQTKEILAYKEAFSHVQLLMVSGASYGEIKSFYESFGLASIPNIRVGHDPNLKLGSIYRLSTYPSLFVYDKKEALVKAFLGNIGIPTILDAVK